MLCLIASKYFNRLGTFPTITKITSIVITIFKIAASNFSLITPFAVFYIVSDKKTVYTYKIVLMFNNISPFAAHHAIFSFMVGVVIKYRRGRIQKVIYFLSGYFVPIFALHNIIARLHVTTNNIGTVFSGTGYIYYRVSK